MSHLRLSRRIGPKWPTLRWGCCMKKIVWSLVIITAVGYYLYSNNDSTQPKTIPSAPQKQLEEKSKLESKQDEAPRIDSRQTKTSSPALKPNRTSPVVKKERIDQETWRPYVDKMLEGETEGIINKIKSGELSVNQLNFEGRTLAHEAAESNVELLEELIELGSDLTIEDDSGDTPLTLGLASLLTHDQEIKLIDLLLEQGPDLERQNHNGQSALSLAVEMDHPEVLQKVLVVAQSKSQLNQVKKESLVEIALKQGSSRSLPTLLTTLELNPNESTTKGETFLTLGIKEGLKGPVVALINLGADPKLKNSKGEAPLQLAYDKVYNAQEPDPKWAFLLEGM